MYLKKDQAGSAPGHTWHEDGQVIEVDDELGHHLLRIPRGGFSEVTAPPAQPDPEPESEDAPKKKGGRPPLPRDEDGDIIRKTEIAE